MRSRVDLAIELRAKLGDETKRVLVLEAPLLASIAHCLGHAVVHLGPDAEADTAELEHPGPAYIGVVKVRGQMIDYHAEMLAGRTPPRIGEFDVVVAWDQVPAYVLAAAHAASGIAIGSTGPSVS